MRNSIIATILFEKESKPIQKYDEAEGNKPFRFFERFISFIEFNQMNMQKSSVNEQRDVDGGR